ncbi:MAG: DUF4012 domain-containing protein [Anaerolineae bacterium]|nr:DUF4012 domain-containing protein [Anaerolineae bacterium]
MPWRSLLITVITLASIALIGGLVLATDATKRMNTSISNLNHVLTTLQNRPGTELTLDDFQRLKASVDDLLNTLGQVRGQAGFLRPFAAANADLNATYLSLDITNELALSVNDLLTALEPTLFFMVAGDEEDTVVRQISAGERITELLRLGRSRFFTATEHLDNARTQLDQMNFDGVSPQTLLNLVTLDNYEKQFREINNSLILLPDALEIALGLTQQQSYLVLSQNSDELRPSGGYLSTYGWITVRNGRIIDYDYSATTATSPNPPSVENPYHPPRWWIPYGDSDSVYAAWDGSWYADFQKTAEMAVWYYDTGNNPESPVSGAIGIDTYAIEALLSAIGSVPVAQYNVVVTADNFRELVYDIRTRGENQHKQFLGDLYRQIFNQWQTAGRSQEVSTRILGVLLQALQEKHVMLYFRDERMNQIVDSLGWSGRQFPALDQDYLMVADANLGNKSNRSVIRQLTYDVAIDENGLLDARATIDYDYPSSIAEQDPAVDPAYHGPLDYRSLLQVFTPLGSVLRETTGATFDVEPIDDPLHYAFVTQIDVDYNSGERIQFSYNTPALIQNLGEYRHYRLLLQKQPGTPAELVSVQVSLPPGASVIQTQPEAAASYNLDRPIVEFRVELAGDRSVDIIYDP